MPKVRRYLKDRRRRPALAAARLRLEKLVALPDAGVANGEAEVEAAGLHRVLEVAGVEWRLPGCSLCVGANGETVPAGQRCVSTSNRNFVGRQGKDSRTHLASPAMAAAAAVTGQITDVRKLMG